MGHLLRSATTGHLLRAAGGHLLKGPTSSSCCYRQARKCSDSTLADLWLAESDIPGFPYFVKRTADSTCYYFLDTDEADPCPTHTLIGAVTAFDSCVACEGESDCIRHECITSNPVDDSDLTLCDATHGAPDAWLVTVEGLANCDCVEAPSAVAAGSKMRVTTDLNGTYLITTLSTACFYQISDTTIPVDGFFDQPIGPLPPADCVTPWRESLRIILDRATLNVGTNNDFYPDDSHWTFAMFGSHRNSGSQINECGSRYFFGRTATAAADCLDIPTIANDLACEGYEPNVIGGCPQAIAGRGGGQDLGFGGTADFTCMDLV